MAQTKVAHGIRVLTRVTLVPGIDLVLGIDLVPGMTSVPGMTRPTRESSAATNRDNARQSGVRSFYSLLGLSEPQWKESNLNSRQRFIAACKSQKVDRPPVWLMRQAGRYLPEYREVRHAHSFWEMVRTPSLAREVTLQPLRRFGMDAAILFSDILIVPDAMGIKVAYETGGPMLSPYVRGPKDLACLKQVDASRAFGYVADALAQLSADLHGGDEKSQKALIGFAGAPFTLAAYMVAGGPSKDVSELKELARREPSFYDELASRIAEVVADLLRLQVRSGADAVQIFDTWSLHLSPDEYSALALPYTVKVIKRLANLQVPTILYVRNSVALLELAACSGANVLSIDPSIDLSSARARIDSMQPEISAPIALQGNFDPAILSLPAQQVALTVRQAVASMDGSGYIANVGQGLTPETPIEGVRAFVSAVQEEND